MMTKIGKTNFVLKVNGQVHQVLAYPYETLLEVLREHLHLTGAKESCGQGACGTCTVLLDGAPVRSCLLLALDARDREITTIEGLASNGKLHPLQEAFVEHHAIQCGFCTSGMILTAKALLDRQPNPTEDEIRHGLSGNVCRCTGYTKIIEAVKAASGKEK
ncbi:MAG: Nicotinate dehydrogenase small FeS subunit [Syntrophorhabdaceae bacterium PtaU1.Bin034]|jgi:carbon-monoxide dehydrogenase small subunit|nr:MAG: Nicotinate dehydrogenase small FeS subunit [Syntrophorhabdaceae bacterium PtaU1.Bin034]